jgi:hypothetical protein
MPFLVQNISSNFSDIITETINSQNSITFEIYVTTCNHISAPGFEAFMVNLSNSILTETLTSNTNYGLNFNNNKTFEEIIVSYVPNP